MKTATVKTRWELYLVFTSVFLIIHCAAHIISSGETKSTWSAIFFNAKPKDEEEGNSRRASKRKRGEVTPATIALM